MPKQQADKKRILNVRVLPGEPTNGSGRVCIHLFVRDAVGGTFVEPHVLHPAVDADNNVIKNQLVARAARGRMACSPKITPYVPIKNGVTTVVLRSDDPRAVTCPKCKESPEYAEMMAKLSGE